MTGAWSRQAIHSPLLRVWLLPPPLFAFLLACTASPTSPPPPVAVTPPTQPASINGTYDGAMQLISGLPMSCGTEDMLTLQVANRAFAYQLNQPQVPWQPVRAFNVVIAADGSFQAQAGTAYIRGTVSGGHMAGDLVGDACGYHFEADRRGTW
jgi:hypothetical protein